MQKTKRHFSPAGVSVRVGKSRAGRGVFAEQIIPTGTCIIEYKGRPASKKEQLADRGKYLFWTSNTTMIDGNIKGNTARFINHSCAPNCEIDIRNKRIFVFALRQIPAGEELTYDYDTEYFEKHIKPKGCLCQKCSPIVL
jgi:SET domain-containing protein